MVILFSRIAILQLDRTYTDKSVYDSYGHFTDDFKKWNYEFHQYIRKEVLSTLTRPHGLFHIGSIGSLIYTIYNVGGIKCLLIESFSFPTFTYMSSNTPTVDVSKSPSIVWKTPINNTIRLGKYRPTKQVYYDGMRIGYCPQTRKYNILNKEGQPLSKVPLSNVRFFKQPFGKFSVIAHVNVNGELWAMDINGKFYDMYRSWNDAYLGKNEIFRRIGQIITETINTFIRRECK